MKVDLSLKNQYINKDNLINDLIPIFNRLSPKDKGDIMEIIYKQKAYSLDSELDKKLEEDSFTQQSYDEKPQEQASYQIKQIINNIQEKKEPIYELYKNLDNKYTLRVVLYNPEQISEFCCTAGKRIMSVCGKNEMMERLEKYGFSAYSFDISKLDVQEIPMKYVSEKAQDKILGSEEVAMKNYWQLRKCLENYINFFQDIYRWNELGMNSEGELVYLHNSLGGGTLRCSMGSDGYPDILNDRGESVFDYIEEMEMTVDDVNAIRGIEKEDYER